MGNSFGTETPPAPDSQEGNALMSAPTSQAQQPMQAPPQGGQQQPQPAPPSREQTVAALRHFDAVKREVEIILANPSLGKSSVKSKIIDGVTRLVSEGFMKPASAVDELAKVPSDPLMQMQWAKGMLSQAQNAENAILDHYGMGNPHLGQVADHFAVPVVGGRDDHRDHMDALMTNYGRKHKNG